jgi:hypothetical protein
MSRPLGRSTAPKPAGGGRGGPSGAVAASRAWSRSTAQQARNLLLVLEEQGRRLCFVLRDRDAKFTHRFDDAFGSHGAEMLLTPVQAPNANAYAERWVRTRRVQIFRQGP